MHSLVTVVLAQAAAGDPQLTEFADTVERERGFGTAATARLIASRFGLRAGVDEAYAADILWTLIAPEIAERLVSRRGWSWDQYQNWLAQTMSDALVGDASHLTRASPSGGDAAPR